jgi:16S rRNA (uracil1498-N3)-methyltransferase
MSSLWLHQSAIPGAGDRIEIPRDEAKHAFGARRLGPGAMVTLFDGQGTVAEARLTDERTRGGDVIVEVVVSSGAPPLSPEVTVAFAVPKGDRLSTLLDGCTQAGASRLIPIECARSVVDADKLDRGERWQRILAEACKVAKRAWMPELVAGGALIDVARAEVARGAAVAVAHTSGEPGRAAMLHAWGASLSADRSRTVFIGPEGGFDDSEIAALRAIGAAVVSLGPCVMRVEIASIAAAATLRA